MIDIKSRKCAHVGRAPTLVLRVMRDRRRVEVQKEWYGQRRRNPQMPMWDNTQLWIRERRATDGVFQVYTGRRRKFLVALLTAYTAACAFSSGVIT